MRLNGMKSIYKKIMANIRPICQIIGLVVIFLLPSLMNISDKVEKQPELTASQDLKDYIFYYIWILLLRADFFIYLLHSF